MTGTVFDIKRFAVHDGAGIRSTLFLKGCPLRCPWCQNPEGLHRAVRLLHQPAKCVLCGSCVSVCANGALTLDNRVHVDQLRCQTCGLCAEICPAAAMELDGWEIDAEKAAESLLRDRAFFRESGGVTLSGGEVLTQSGFALEVLRLCKEAGVNTAIESCLYALWKVLESFLPLVDQFMIDIKLFDTRLHRELLGVDNELILSNYRQLVQCGAGVIVRTPLIPGYTASEDNVRAIARFVAASDPNASYELLNFNPLCRSKYAALEWNYPVEGNALTPEEMEGFYEILRQEGVCHIIRE